MKDERGDPLQVLWPGSHCILLIPRDPGMAGLITAVAIYGGDRILYQVAWWDDRLRREDWLEACEVAPVKADSARPIGFITELSFEQ